MAATLFNTETHSASSVTILPTRGRLLLVDDDEDFRKSCAAILQRHQFECLVAADTDDALAILRSQPIEALLADLHMPCGSGIDLVRRVSEVKRGLPCFLLTGQPSWESAAKCIGLRVAGYIEKPPVFSDLVPQLEESILAYRRLQIVQLSRERLSQWEQQLSVLEESLIKNRKEHTPGDYLRIALQHIAAQLAEFARATCLASDLDNSANDLANLQLLGAIRKTVAVLEETRRSFKSKELGELRKELTGILTAAERFPHREELTCRRKDSPLGADRNC